MLKREIKYEDFNGNEAVETFYFNISKPELIELDVTFEGGFAGMLEHIIETKNNQELVKKFKEIILLAYGVKSEDGKKFVKSDALREEFSQTAAYQSLFMELASDDGAAVTFLRGVLPKDIAGSIPDQPELTSVPTPGV